MEENLSCDPQCLIYTFLRFKVSVQIDTLFWSKETFFTLSILYVLG